MRPLSRPGALLELGRELVVGAVAAATPGRADRAGPRRAVDAGVDVTRPRRADDACSISSTRLARDGPGGVVQVYLDAVEDAVRRTRAGLAALIVRRRRRTVGSVDVEGALGVRRPGFDVYFSDRLDERRRARPRARRTTWPRIHAAHRASTGWLANNACSCVDRRELERLAVLGDRFASAASVL